MKFIDILKESDDVEQYEEPMNEGRVGNLGMGITEKELKKVSAVYKAIKKGFFVYNSESIYGYELPDDYYAHRDELGNVCIKMTGQSNQEPKFFTKIKMTDSELIRPIHPRFTGLTDWIKDNVIDKFEQFNIKFIF